MRGRRGAPRSKAHRSGLLARLTTGSFLAASGTTFGTLVTGLVSSLITSRLVGADRIGQFAIAGAPVLLALNLSGLDEQRLIVRKAHATSVSDSFWAVLNVSFRLTAKVATLIGIGTIALYATVFNLERFILPSLAMLAMYCLLDNTISALDGALLASGKVGALTFARIITPLMYCGNVIALHFLGVRFWVLILGQLVSSVVVLTLRVVITRHILFGQPRVHDRPALVREVAQMQSRLLQFSIVYGVLHAVPPYIIRRYGSAFLGAYARTDAITSRIWSFFSIFELSRFRDVQEGFASDTQTVGYFRRLKLISAVLLPLCSLLGVAVVLTLPIYGRSFVVEHRERLALLGLTYGMESITVLGLSPIWARFEVRTLMRRRVLTYLPALALLGLTQLFRLEALGSITAAYALANILQLYGTSSLLRDQLDATHYRAIRRELDQITAHVLICASAMTFYVTCGGSILGLVAAGFILMSIAILRSTELFTTFVRRTAPPPTAVAEPVSAGSGPLD